MKNFSKLVLTALSAATLAACGGADGSGDTATSIGTRNPPTNAELAQQNQGGQANPGTQSKAVNIAVGEEALASRAGEDLSGHNSAPNAAEEPLKKGKSQLQGDLKRIQEGRSEGFRPGKDVKKEKAGKVGKAVNTNASLFAQSGVVTQAAAPLPIGQTSPVAPPLASIPADARTKGAFTGLYNWPLIPIHLTMMADGRLMSYGSNELGWQTGKTIYAIFNPADGLINGHMVLPKDTLADLFCSAAIWLPVTSQVLTVGGDVWDAAAGYTTNEGNNSSTIYSPGSNTMVAGNNMKLPRWYASTTMMTDGTVFVNGGLGGEAYPELRLANGTFKAMTGANTSRLDYWYPRNWLNSDGRIFGYDTYGNYYYINTSGTGTLKIVNQWDTNKFGDMGSSVLIGPGRILQLSGYDNSASIIDFRTNNAPTLTPTSPMSKTRLNVTATTLPNGQVLATGGSTVYNELTGVSLNAEIWDPKTGRWTVGAAGALARLYHSMAMLQPDGTVLVGGGGAWGPLSNENVEFYYPPYLFDQATGALATRANITDASTTAQVGGTFTLTVDDAAAPITRITMIKNPSITHSYNLDQSFNDLTFTRSGNVLTVKMPTKAVDATPGNYMIFAQTTAGVPAQARIIKVDPGTAAATASPTNLGATVTASGVNLTWTQGAGTVSTNVIERASAANGPFTQIASLTARTAYTDANTTAGTYYYRVSSITSTGATSAPSAVAVATIVATQPPPTATIPGAPTGVTAAATGTNISISWIQGAGTVTGNTVQRATTAAGPFTNLVVGGPITTYSDGGLAAGTYYYRVLATNAQGPSAPSAAVSATVATAPTGTLPLPTGLSGYPCGTSCWTTDTGVHFNWAKVVGATGYTVNRSTTGAAGPWTTVGTVATNVFVDKNVTTGTVYFYQVKATSATAASLFATLKYSITSDITLGTTTPPPVTPPPVTPPPVTPPPTGTGGTFAIESQGETKYLVMNWWRGDPAKENGLRDPSKVTCTGPATTGGNCVLGEHKTFKPQAFNIATAPAAVSGLVMMDIPQFVNGIFEYAHYRLPVELIKTGCTFKVQHVRTHGNLEFPLNPPGLEILDHKFTLTQALCDAYPAGPMTQAWLNTLNTALTTYLGPKTAYNPEAYPYNDPRTGRDPSQGAGL